MKTKQEEYQRTNLFAILTGLVVVVVAWWWWWAWGAGGASESYRDYSYRRSTVQRGQDAVSTLLVVVLGLDTAAIQLCNRWPELTMWPGKNERLFFCTTTRRRQPAGNSSLLLLLLAGAPPACCCCWRRRARPACFIIFWEKSVTLPFGRSRFTTTTTSTPRSSRGVIINR